MTKSVTVVRAKEPPSTYVGFEPSGSCSTRAFHRPVSPALALRWRCAASCRSSCAFSRCCTTRRCFARRPPNTITASTMTAAIAITIQIQVAIESPFVVQATHARTRESLSPGPELDLGEAELASPFGYLVGNLREEPTLLGAGEAFANSLDRVSLLTLTHIADLVYSR